MSSYEQPEWGIKIAKYFVLPQRVILSLMGFFSIVCGYNMRICLSVAITQMVIPRPAPNTTSELSGECPKDESAESMMKVPKNTGDFSWSEEEQGFVLSSFYIGYIITHLPGGVLSEKFGGKWVLCVGVFLSVLCSMITPMAVRLGGSTSLVVVRVIMGMGQGVLYPTLSTLLSAWVPLKERSKLGALTLGGGQVGTIFGNSISGLLLDAYVWDVTFYFFGIMGLLWCIIFALLCYSNPGTHPFIKEQEKEYLMTEMGSLQRKTDLPPVPWLMIMTNAPMLALICAQIGHDWGFYIMISDLPKYLADVMQFSIKENGFYSSMPYLMMWIFSLITGFIADYTLQHNKLSVTNSRKMYTTIAAVGPGIFMVLASYAGCHKFLVVTYFTISMGLMGGFYAGMKLSPLDMSPNYSGTLMAITNGIGAITGILAPYSVGLMTPNANLFEWRLVFWFAFIILTVTSVVYCIWASGEIQPFNDYKPAEKKEG